MGKKFRDQVAHYLSDFSREDVCFFAWLCAVRALPFLALGGDFDYWKNAKNGDQRQKHLLAVLNAIDVAAYAANAYVAAYAAYTDAADAADAAANAYADAADLADIFGAFIYDDDADTLTPAADAYVAYTDDAAYVAYAAAYAADTSAAYTDDAYITCAVAYAADAAAYTYAAAYTARLAIDLQTILFEDLEIIKAGKHNFKNDTAVYGSIWNKFQCVLRDLGCEYWGEWYAQVFAKGFILDDKDREEIELRLSVPGEIRARGASDVARYVLELKKYGVARLNEARVIILGNKGSGKTSLAWRLKDPTHKMPGAYESTEGVDITDWVVPDDPKQPDSKVNVHVWDFAGHVIAHAVHRYFMSERCLYILVIDGRTEGDNYTRYWLEQIRNYGGNSPVLVLVNLRDRHHVGILKNTLKKEFESIVAFDQVNIGAGGDPLEEFRQKVMGILRDSPLWKNKKMSVTAYKVKEVLREKFAQSISFIERAEFDRIAADKGVETEKTRRQLLVDLRDLGLCLWYDNDDVCKFDVLVLNPSWISYGIYRLINWGLNNGQATLSISDFTKAFTGVDGSKYPEEKAVFLFQLMKTYQLAFSKRGVDDEIFVPLLLSADRTDDGLLPAFPDGDRLKMEYTANHALPPYTVARLAVACSDELVADRSWRFGAVFRWAGIDALVEESAYARSVTVYVKGRGPKQTMYLVQLRDKLNEIFKDYASDRPDLKYEVISPSDWSKGHVDSNKVLQPDYSIIGNANAGQKQVLPDGTLVPTEPTVQNYQLNYIMNCKNVTISQNNGVDIKELVRLIEAVQKAMPVGLSDDDIESMSDSLDVIRDELPQKQPRKGFLKIASDKLKEIEKKANLHKLKEAAEFSATVVALVQFIFGR